jgi:hypothetical protein
MVNFIALIDYENDVKERPILMGLVPLKNPKYPEEVMRTTFSYQ